MGEQEYLKVKKKFKLVTEEHVNDNFRFGPSKIYKACRKIKLLLRMGTKFQEVGFFIVEGANIPVLLGNDVMDHLEANIDMKARELIFKHLGAAIPMIKTAGGHFVISMNEFVEVTGPQNANIKDEEAEAVMTIMYASVDSKEELENLHNQVGHKVFNEVSLNKDEETQLIKAHKYFGHRSGRKIWELFAKSGRLRGKKKAALEIIDRCKICSHYKKSPPRPRVGLPVANDFNKVVGLDLKVVDQKKNHYILWMVDLFSKLTKGVFLKDKTPASIIEGIITGWVIGDGGGPGHPRRGFWSDNGGEFLNQELIDYAATQNIQIKMTAANAPWQNGCVERNHATADIIYQKLLDEDPNMPHQAAVNKAAFAKNSEVNKSKFT